MSFLLTFLDSLLQRILHVTLLADHLDSHLYSLAGDSILCLFLVRSESFGVIMNQILSRIQDPDSRSRFSMEIRKLSEVMMKFGMIQQQKVSAGTLSIGYGENNTLHSLQNYKEFSDTFTLFIVKVRGIVCIR